MASHKDPSWVQDFSPFNDLPDQIKEGEIDMYADDTTLFYIGPSVDVVCDALNRILGDVHNWCRNNKFTIHIVGNQRSWYSIETAFVAP